MKLKMIQAFMSTAKVFATCSTATRLKVGAICVDCTGSQIISIGYNGQPSGWDNQCEDENNITKPTVIHAESNCIAKLAKQNGGGSGAYLFVTHSPCLECAKLIMQAGIQHVYYEKMYRSSDGIDFLQACGINVIQCDVESEK